MTFKESVQDDLDHVFLDPDIFGELHQVNGKDVLVVLAETYQNQSNDNGAGSGTSSRSMGVTRRYDQTDSVQQSLFIREQDITGNVTAGARMTLDGERYTIRSASLHWGLWELTIGRSRA